MRNSTRPIRTLVLLLIAAMAMFAVAGEVVLRQRTEPLGAPRTHGIKGTPPTPNDEVPF